MVGHGETCVERYCDLGNKSVLQLKQAETLCTDHQLDPRRLFEVIGELAPVSASD